MKTIFSSGGALALMLLSCVALGDGTPTKVECLDAHGDGQALRKAGKLRQAQKKLALCRNPVCPKEAREECATMLGEVERDLPTVVLVAKRGNTELEQVKVSVDGEALTSKLDGMAIAVDPGVHTFVFEMAGAPAVSQRVTIKVGEKNQRIQIAFEVEPVAGTSSASAASPAPPPSGAASTTGKTDDAAMQRTFGYVALGAGVVALAIGTIYGLKYNSAQGDVNDVAASCTGLVEPAFSTCNARVDAAKHDRDANKPLFVGGLVAGGALGTTGAILLLTSTSTQTSSSGFRIVPTVGAVNQVSVFGSW